MTGPTLPHPAELLTALETRIVLARSKAKLLQVQAALEPDPATAKRLSAEVEQARSDMLAWELAGQCLRESIRLRAEAEQLLTGWPAKPERPKLRIVATST